MQRGEVWWVNFNPQRGMEIKKFRPAVVLTANVLNQVRGTVVVVPLSTSAKLHPPLTISLPSVGKNSVAVCDQLCATDKGRFGEKICNLSTQDFNVLTDSIKIILGLT
jgi:mRNA interferase MazF